jgi:hypothetical protein
MPNWCYNKLQVTPRSNWAESEVNELEDMMRDGFSLEKITPTPKELVDKPAPQVSKPSEVALPAWYSWRVKNWGTKWDVLHTSLDSEKDVLFEYAGCPHGFDEIQTEFQTAWSPPIAALKTLSTKLTNLIFKLEYIDELMNFKGRAVIQDGEVSDIHKEIPVEENIQEQFLKDAEKNND